MIEEKLVTPPIRAALMEESGHEPNAKTPTRDWWLHWNAVTLRGNRNAADIDALEADVAAFQTHLDNLQQMVRASPHGTRLTAAAVPAGALWVETDRGNVIYQAQGVDWVYISGAMSAVLADKPADLGVLDTGFLFHGEDYAHTWRWTGTGWEYAPGDRQSGELAWFTANPGIGWALCNGSAATRTLSTAETAAFTAPDLIGRYAKGAAAYTGTSVPAGSLSLSGSTDAEAAHTHSVTTGSVSSNPSVDPDITWASGTTGFYASKNNAHTHLVPGQTVISGAGSPHTHGLGSVSVSGSPEPAHIDVLPYFRL